MENNIQGNGNQDKRAKLKMVHARRNQANKKQRKIQVTNSET